MTDTNWTNRLLVALVLAAAPMAMAQTPLGTAYTYQGRLNAEGSPANGAYDMEFTLWDDPVAGAQVGPTLTYDGLGGNPAPIDVVDGLFTVALDFGDVFSGNELWLEVAVSGTPLTPRQPLSATPYASFAGAPWVTSGADVSYLTGNVEIGTGQVLGYAPSDAFTYDGQTMGHYSLGWFEDSWNFGGATAWISSFAGLKFFTAGAPRVAIRSNGYVGIGTTTPGGPLHAVGSEGFVNYGAVTGVATGVGGNGVVGRADNSADAWGVWGDSTAGVGVVGLSDTGMGCFFQAPKNVLMGNVGIGTLSPTNALSVAGSADFSSNVSLGGRLSAGWLSVNSGGSPFSVGVQSSSGIGTWVELNNTTPGGRVYSLISTGDGNTEGAGAFLIRDSSNSVVRMTIDPNGNVGLGTITPGAKLHVVGGVQAEGQTTAHTQGAHLEWNKNGGDGATWLLNQKGLGSGGMRFGEVDSANTVTERMRIESNGNVGIATAAPGFTLHVNGTAGKPGGGSWSVASDARLKKNIEPMNGVLDRVLSLHGVTFEYRDPAAINELPGTRMGMVAQEVEQAFPDWVDTAADGYKRVTYRGFEAVTVEALRDLRAEKDAEIEALRSQKDAEIRDLNERLTRLEELVGKLTGK